MVTLLGTNLQFATQEYDQRGSTGDRISKIGEVMEVDVPKKGVQWGKYLRVQVQVDTSEKLIRGKGVSIEEDGGRWAFFKYERLPNFCYVCGMLDHGEKECMEKENGGVGDDGKGIMQYGAWMRGEPGRRYGYDSGFREGKGWAKKRMEETTKGGARVGSLDGREDVGQKAELGGGPMAETNSEAAKSKSHCIEKIKAKDKNEAEFHERGKVKEEGRKVDKPLTILSTHIVETTLAKGKDAEAMQWEKTTGEGAKENPDGKI